MRKLHPIRQSFSERFWKYVNKTDGCWLWTGFLDKNGRGHLRRGRATESWEGAHRASWLIHHGPIPDGKFVLHQCDNPTCVRPDHLYLGTQQDNMRDVKTRRRSGWLGKGHLLTGEQNPNARLTWPIVKAIREDFSGGISGKILAKKYRVSDVSIYHIVHNRTWVV